MLVGVKILIIIALMGGLIAYMGDKLGTKRPVTIVTIIDVCLGRNPKRDIRRLPILVPSLSPM